MDKNILTHSKGIVSSRNIADYFGKKISYRTSIASSDLLLTWGRKIKSEKIEVLAQKHQKKLIRIEDGFISYRLHPLLDNFRLSLIIDEEGIYYDSSRPHGLETIIFKLARDFGETMRLRAQKVRRKLCEYNISKYNITQKSADNFFKAYSKQKRVLLIDQTVGDRSIFHAKANRETFQQMLAAAKKENPEAQLFILSHPDVQLGKKKGYLHQMHTHGLATVPFELNAMSVLKQIDHVYTVSSQMGFEAILREKKVTVFGQAFYGGWGLTDDRTTYPRKRLQIDIDQLTYGSLIAYPHYRLPYLNRPAQIEEVIDYLAFNPYRNIERFTKIYALGFSLWKRIFVARYMRPYCETLLFVKKLPSKIFKHEAVLVWGYKNKLPPQPSSTVLRMEDGFIRSVGLGSDLKLPSSVVIEKKGLYYDASQSTTLESILQTVNFSETTLVRSEKLIQMIKQYTITKYNVQSHITLNVPSHRHVCLVVGQVVSDASVSLSGADIKSDQELLEKVRHDFPDAYIIYKPHPDILAKNRRQGPVNSALYDQIVIKESIISCFKVAHSVHLISSLAGFEALIHQKLVYTYGLPFYAGWGLTIDAVPCVRRTRRLELSALVAGCLIAYPHYYNWSSAKLTDVEDIILEIHKALETNKKQVLSRNKLFRFGIKLRYLYQSIADSYL